MKITHAGSIIEYTLFSAFSYFSCKPKHCVYWLSKVYKLHLDGYGRVILLETTNAETS